MKSLSKLQFYAIMASVCWAFAVAVYVRQNEMPKAQQYATTRYFVCAESEAGKGGNEACLKRVEDDWNEWMNRQWGTIARMALVPIGVGWAVGLVGMRVFRRRAGDDPA